MEGPIGMAIGWSFTSYPRQTVFQNVRRWTLSGASFGTLWKQPLQKTLTIQKCTMWHRARDGELRERRLMVALFSGLTYASAIEMNCQ
jgi:hypothetical protein